MLGAEGGGGIVGQGGEAVRPKCCKLWRSNSVAFRGGKWEIGILGGCAWFEGGLRDSKLSFNSSKFTIPKQAPINQRTKT